MADNRQAFIKQQLQAGLRHDEIRRELISQGYGSAGFEEEYAAMASELGIAEPKPKQKPLSWEATPEPAATGPVPLPSIGGMLKAGVVAVRAHLGAIIGTVVLSAIAVVLLSVFPAAPTPYLDGYLYLGAWTAVTLIAVVLTMVGSLALVYVVIMGDTGANYAQGLQWTFARIFSVSWLGIVGAVISLMAFALLFIPGLLFTLFNSFSFISLVKEDQRGVIAIVRSTDLVRGAFVDILIRFLVLLGSAAGLSALMALLAMQLQPLVPTVPMIGDMLLIPFLFVQLAIAVFIVGSVMSVYRSRVRAKSFFDRSQYRFLTWLYRGVVLIGFIIPIALVTLGVVSVAQYLPQTDFSWEEIGDPFSEVDTLESDVNDYVIERRVDTMFEAAQLQKRRMTNFDGVCRDVLIEAPARCQNTLDELVIYAPLGDGTFYCRDAAGFLGSVASAPRGTTCR